MLKRLRSPRPCVRSGFLSLAIFCFPVLLAAQQSLEGRASPGGPQEIATAQQKAQELLDEVKGQKALAEFRALVELHPQESLHRIDLAWALLKLGLGEAAREQARRAVELEPSSARAHAELGLILEHDLLGRPFKPGADLQQARAAFEKAIELAPDDVTIRSDYAIVLEYNRDGMRYAPDVDLNAAIDQHRKVQGQNASLPRSFAYLLLRAGRYDELQGVSTPVDIRLAAIAASQGVPAAVREAETLDAGSRQSQLQAAGPLLMQSRLYEAASGMLRAAASGPTSSSILTLAASVERMKRYEDLLTVRSDPSTVAKELFAQGFLGARGEKLYPLLSKAGQDELRRTPELVPLIVRPALAQLAGVGGQINFTSADSAVSSLKPNVEGNDASGYRVKLNPLPMPLYIVSENGEYRVLSAGRSDFALAEGALHFLQQGNLTVARQWLDWAVADSNLNDINGDSLNIVALFAIWFNSPVKDGARMRMAAATLLSSSPEAAASVLPILQESRNATTGLVRQGLSLAYATALLTLGRYEDSLAIGQQLMRDAPDSRAIFLVAECMFHLKRMPELRTLLQRELPKVKDKEDVGMLLAAIELYQGDSAQAEARVKALTASEPDAQSLMLTWFSLYRDQIAEKEIADFQSVAMAKPLFNSKWMRMQATLYAETGNVAGALMMLGQSLDADGRTRLASDDWYVLGRLYEQYGERAASEAAYRKAIERTEFKPTLDSAYMLAQRRLNRLEVIK
jgi:tetratricopeptide (TPR) repeat protein